MQRLKAISLGTIILTLAVLTTVPHSASGDEEGGAHANWQRWLDRELPLLGHRNWIVVADAAYPAQTSPGIETIYAGGDQLEAVGAVLTAIDAAKHVQALPMVDAELKAVAEADAPGVDAYRKQLSRLLRGRPVVKLPHEEIIGKLDQDARQFRVLIIKTEMTIPYTSVFVQLDCGYWGPEQEARLREALESAP